MHLLKLMWVTAINLYWKKAGWLVYSEAWKCNRWLRVASSASGYFFTCTHSFHAMKGHNSEATKQMSKSYGSEGKPARRGTCWPEENSSVDLPFPHWSLSLYTSTWANVCVTWSFVASKGLCELDQKERWGGRAACAGNDEPSAVFRGICSGLYPSYHNDTAVLTVFLKSPPCLWKKKPSALNNNLCLI